MDRPLEDGKPIHPGSYKTRLQSYLLASWRVRHSRKGHTFRLSCPTRPALKPQLEAWQSHGEVQGQPIDVRLLAAWLKAAGGPDWEIMHVFDIGVPIGVNVYLPRSPSIFDDTCHWIRSGQEAFGGASGLAASVQGAICDNYSSAKAFVKDVAVTLLVQAQRGQVLVLTEQEARLRYGSRLAIASLGALAKG